MQTQVSSSAQATTKATTISFWSMIELDLFDVSVSAVKSTIGWSLERFLTHQSSLVEKLV